jgi:hypothetical protein
VSSRRDLSIAAVVIGWITVILTLDHFASFGESCALGVGTWGLLLALLAREPRRVRLQVAVVVVFATAVEYTFSGWLGVYIYRLHTVPWFVPPGHGLVYLAALAIGRAPAVIDRRRWLLAATAGLAVGYAGWGLLVSGRLDVLGAFWAVCLLASLRWSRQPTVFVGAFVVVTYLELLGTHLGIWTWQIKDPIAHLVAMGNPPSGAAGGYGFFDLAALWVSDRVAARRGRSVTATSLGTAGEDAQDLRMQEPVAAHDTAQARVGAA